MEGEPRTLDRPGARLEFQHQPASVPAGPGRPTAAPEREPRVPAGLPGAENNQQPSGTRRILVVDDEPTIRAVLTDLLRFEGYEVRQAAHGLEALDTLNGWRPDTIVLDLMMPVMDGWAFAEAAHNLLGANSVPILVASASPDLTNAAVSLRRFGVRAAVAKPFDVDVLLAAIEHLAERRSVDAWPVSSSG